METTSYVASQLSDGEWRVPAHQVGVCHTLYDHVRKYKDEKHRVLCEFLIRAPSRRSQPDYYDVISSPMDLMKIQVRRDIYRTWHAQVHVLLAYCHVRVYRHASTHMCACQYMRLHQYSIWILYMYASCTGTPCSLSMSLTEPRYAFPSFYRLGTRLTM